MTLPAPPITPDAFAPYGEVIRAEGAHVPINAGLCRRYTDLATLDIVDGRAGLSLFAADIRPLPHTCDLLERHPQGSQCFIPMGGSRYLVVVAPDDGGRPGAPVAFAAGPQDVVNIARNTWHGVLAPIDGSGLFAVIDRIGPGANLQEHRLDPPLTVAPA